MSYYKSDELGLALDAVVESIRRKPSNIEIALIAACVVSVLKIIYKPNIAREHSPNIIGRAVASNVFLQLIFSTTAPAEYFKNALGCSQGDLIEQFDKIVLQFPIYWFNCPPLVKTWLDDVFTYGWAYGSVNKMKNRNVSLLVTAGIKEEEKD